MGQLAQLKFSIRSINLTVNYNLAINEMAKKSYEQFEEFKQFQKLKRELQLSDKSSQFVKELIELQRNLNYRIDYKP